MDDTLLYALGGLIVGISGSYLLREAYIERKIKRLMEENEDLEAELLSCQNTMRSVEGNKAKRDKAERQQAMMLEFAQAMQSGENIENVIKTLGAKYPDIAMELVKKGLKL